MTTTEHWFATRGLPTFSRHPSTRPVRATIQLLLAAVVLEVAAAAPSATWPWWADLAAVIAVTTTGLGALAALGHTPPGVTTRNWARWAIEVTFLTAPAALVWAFNQSPGHVIETVTGNTLILAVLAADDRYKLVALVQWGARYSFGQLRSSLRRLARSVPLLAVVVLSLLFTNELWQVTAQITTGNLIAAAGLLAAAGVGFAVVQARDGIREITDRREFNDLVTATPAAGAAEPEKTWPLGRRERANVSVLLYVAQTTTVFIAAGLFALLLLAFSSVAVPEATLDTWLARAPSTLVHVEFGIEFLITREQVAMAMLLAGFSSLVFAVSLATDEEFQTVIRTEIASHIAVAFAVRAAYLDHLDNTSPSSRRNRRRTP